MGEARFSLLQMIREYAQARLVEQGTYDQLCELHGTLYHRLVRESLPLVRGPQAERILNRLEIEHNNLRAALGWHLASSTVAGLRLATLLADSLWDIRGYFSEGRLWLEKFLAAAAHRSTDGSAETPGWCAAAGPVSPYTRATIPRPFVYTDRCSPSVVPTSRTRQRWPLTGWG